MVPTDMPLKKPTTSCTGWLQALTAASGAAPAQLPTISASAVLYSCWNRYPMNTGIA